MPRLVTFPHCDQGWIDYRNRNEYNRPVYLPERRHLQRADPMYGCLTRPRKRAETAYGRLASPYWSNVDYNLASF